jgi:tripartite-type tricarboxylate transporter receptor subunit TctC
MHSITRRSVLAAGATLGLAAPAFAQRAGGLPSRPLRIICPAQGGSFTDILDRLVADQLRESFGQPVIVDNKPGANGVIAAGELARATADGTTIGHMISSALVLATLTVSRLPFRNEDFQPLTVAYRGATAMGVSPRLPVHNLRDLVALSRERGSISYGTIGRATPSHLLVEMLSAESGANFENIVYRSEAAAVLDVLAGTIPVVVGATMNLLEQHRAGELRIIGISTADRLPGLPDIPTFREQGFEAMVYTWFHAFLMPAGAPAPIVRRIHDALANAMRSGPFRAMLTPDLISEVTTPEELGDLIRGDVVRLGRFIRERGLTAG